MTFRCVSLLMGMAVFLLFNAACSTTQTASDILNVRDYGAVGDGSTNDTKAFVKTVKAAQANGDISTILIPSGNYRIDSLVIEGLRGIVIKGSGSYRSRLVSSGVAKNFIQLGKLPEQKKDYQKAALKHCRIENLRIETPSVIGVGLSLLNAQDNIIQSVEVRGFETNIRVDYSWINTFRNVISVAYRQSGVELRGNGLNANLFESCRVTSSDPEAVAYRVSGNSSTFINCTAEGGGIGWEFEYCRKATLIGCHSEHGIPFRVLRRVGVIGIDGHFIWKPSSLWDRQSSWQAESISMRNCLLYSDSKNLTWEVPGKEYQLEGNLQSKVY
jgi:hypothetical protein